VIVPTAEPTLRALLRGARDAASGDIPAALRLAVVRAAHEPGMLEAIHRSVASGVWRRLIREELLTPQRAR
jgi:hypothetical protein